MNRSPGTTQQKQVIAQVRARDFWLDHSAILFTRPAYRSTARNQRGRDDSKRTEALAIWQSSAPARTLAPGNDEYNVIASKNERVEQ
jgi:hypothetical protein